MATSATPPEILRVRQSTDPALGAAFGVITVLGSRRAGMIEVATFRQDAEYGDGRHPDHVTFSSAREDAARRDFTINGMFFDPVERKVIDYVGGQEDLQNRLIRAIGPPRLRFGEDKLRMLARSVSPPCSDLRSMRKRPPRSARWPAGSWSSAPSGSPWKCAAC